MRKIDEIILTILSRVTVEGNTILLTCGQLERKQYLAVNEILENMGGKWNKKAKGHIFSEDPTDRLEAVLLTGEITPPKKNGYFPTPSEVVTRLVELAGLEWGMTVLEPSAGQGAIADEIIKIVGKHHLSCYEILEENCKVLQGKGYEYSNVDFLGQTDVPYVDRVIMNPPFSVEGNGQSDITHVLHAWEFLKSGGRLVSVMSAGITFRVNRKTVEFRELVNAHGHIERLTEGSFKESGTAVSAVIVVMDKPNRRETP